MALVELHSSRVATTKISKCNAMPLVRVSLAFQHNSTLGQKKKGHEHFTFCQHCTKTGRIYHWANFLTKRMGCSLKTLEKNAGKWRATGSYKVMPFLGFRVQACKQSSYSEKEKSNIRAKYTSLKNVGVLQRAGWCTKPYHFVGIIFTSTHSFFRLFARPRGL